MSFDSIILTINNALGPFVHMGSSNLSMALLDFGLI